MQEVPPAQQRYLDRVVSTLRDRLGSELIGVYLHGSLAMGGFTPGRSDVDVLAVCADPLAAQRSIELGDALAALPVPGSGGDLEFSLVAQSAVRAHSEAPPFEVHVSTHEEPFVIDGHDRPGDPDLVIHFAVVRAHGIPLQGPEPAEVFPEPDRALLIAALRGDLEWARSRGAAAWEGHDVPESASIAYQVLNGARILRYLETGEFVSKVEGAAWLERADPDPDVRAVLEAGLAYQRGGAPDPSDPRSARAFLERVEAALRAAMSDG